jgi:site-specific DNA-methyltransferase (adenine-specific)
MKRKLIIPKAYYSNKDKSFFLIHGDCLKVLAELPENCVDMIFAGPPYFLSNGGISCHAGKMVLVHKGDWDKSQGIVKDYEFIKQWLSACQRVLKENGTIWVSGTNHVIYTVGYAMHELGFKILNDIVWFKRNAPPNLSCRYFTHSTETILWAAKNKKSRHYINMPFMKELSNTGQAVNLWNIPLARHKTPHPTEKPESLMERIILIGSREGDIILDPFMGSGTTGAVACCLKRKFIGIEMDGGYIKMAENRIKEAKAQNKAVCLNLGS